MLDVIHRQKDIQYSSRVASHIARQQQTHRLRHIVKQLVGYIPEAQRNSDAVRDLAGYGCMTQMHVVRLLAPRLDNEDQSKDVDFSPTGIRSRWNSGLANTRRAIEQAPWQGAFDPIEGVILHEPTDDGAWGPAVVSGAARLSKITALPADQPGVIETPRVTSTAA